MVTRVLVFGLLSMTLSYLTGLNKQQAIFPLLMTMAAVVVLRILWPTHK